MISTRLTTATIGLVMMAVAGAASAGTILLSGDNNTTDTLGVVGNESLFFSNVLAGGTNVVVLEFNCVGCGSAANTTAEVNNFYNSIGGVTSNLLLGPVTNAALAGVDLFVAPLPDDPFAAGEISALSAFLDGGGTAFFLGENDNSAFTARNNAINSAIAALGGTMALQPAALSGPGVLTADPFTAGLTDLRYIAGSQANGGKTLYANSAGAPFVARQEVGGGPGGPAGVPEPTTLLLLGLGLAGLGFARRRLH